MARSRYTQRMKRFLVLVLVAVFNRQAALATLIVSVPANGGFVVAADTRAVFLDTVCDGVRKIVQPQKRRNTVVLAAGTATVFRFDKTPSHPCEYMKSGPRILDIPHLISMRLDETKNGVLSEAEVNNIANESFSEVKAFDQANRNLHPLNYYMGIGFQIDIVSYDGNTSTVLIGDFGVKVDSTGTPQLFMMPFNRLSRADKLAIVITGHKSFARKYVHTAQMQAIFEKTIDQVSLTDATSAALRYIADAEKSVKTAKEPGIYIGGPIDVATITKAGIQIKRH
jgi:hypothetical protein